MCGISLKDRRTNEELRRLVGVEPITTFIRSGRLRWYGHVMRKGDENWVKKCMEYRVEGRRPVGRPRKTWLDSVEVDMAELEIDKEDVHDRSKWRRIVNVMKKKSNPIGKRTINRYYNIWKILKTIIGTNSKSSINTTFTINDKLVTYSKEIANGFTNYFVSIGLLLANDIRCSVNPMSYVKSIQNSIVIVKISCLEVERVISSLKNSSADHLQKVSSPKS